MRVIVRVDPSGQQDVIARIRGQTSDLPVQIIEVPGAGLEADLASQMQTAAELARLHRAQVVVWLDPAPEREVQVLLYTATPETGRVLVRQLSPETSYKEQTNENSPILSSGTLEAIALVVRTTLRALTLGGEIGVRPQQAVAARAASAEKRRPAPKPLDPSPSAVSPFKLFAFAGWQAVIDGQSSIGQQGIAGRLGAAWHRLRLSLTGSFSLPADLEDRLSTITLSRHAASLFGGYSLLRESGYRLDAGLHAGVAFFLTRDRDRAPYPLRDRTQPAAPGHEPFARASRYRPHGRKEVRIGELRQDQAL
jgi:hypothetical protein